MFLQHYGMDSTLGHKFRASLEALQLEIGCSGCPLAMNFDRYGILATPCWMKSLWERLSHFDFKLHVKYPSLEPQREGDSLIMEFFLSGWLQRETTAPTKPMQDSTEGYICL